MVTGQGKAIANGQGTGLVSYVVSGISLGTVNAVIATRRSPHSFGIYRLMPMRGQHHAPQLVHMITPPGWPRVWIPRLRPHVRLPRKLPIPGVLEGGIWQTLSVFPMCGLTLVRGCGGDLLLRWPGRVAALGCLVLVSPFYLLCFLVGQGLLPFGRPAPRWSRFCP